MTPDQRYVIAELLADLLGDGHADMVAEVVQSELQQMGPHLQQLAQHVGGKPAAGELRRWHSARGAAAEAGQPAAGMQSHRSGERNVPLGGRQEAALPQPAASVSESGVDARGTKRARLSGNE